MLRLDLYMKKSHVGCHHSKASIVLSAQDCRQEMKLGGVFFRTKVENGGVFCKKWKVRGL